MIQYIYFVKCPGCEDEHFDFFDEAKEFALGCLSQKPIITQTEVCRNDFGECTDSADLGTVWSWEDIMKDTTTDADPAVSVFTKDDLECMNRTGKPCCDAEFDNLDNSVDFEIDEISERDPITEESVPRHPVVGATRAPKETEYVIVFKHPHTGKHYLLSRNFTITTDINKAMTYPGKFSAEDEIKYAEDAADKYGFKFEVEIDSQHSDTYYDDYRSVNFFVTTVADAKKLSGVTDKVSSQDSLRKPIPEGITLESLVEALEESEDEVECKNCFDLFPKVDCTKQEHGYICPVCGNTTEPLADSLEDTLTGLITDEFEAIDGYEAAVEAVQQANLSDDEKVEILDTLGHIKKEEEEHIEELKELSGNSEYHTASEDPITLHEDEEEDELEIDEDTVECTWCNGLFDKSECRYEVDLGWLCSRCEMAIKSRGETLTFKEGNYWDFLDEDTNSSKTTSTWTCIFDGKEIGTVEAATEEEAYVAMERKYPEYPYGLYDGVAEVRSNTLEEAAEIHDLGNEYDGGYPAETSEVSDSHLKLCPECGKETFDIETGICVNCGFN